MRLSFARCLIGAVVLVNLQCAIVFMLKPQVFMGAFELTDVSGAAVVRGIGVLFLMWNVPYLVALHNPIRNRLALYEALVMQSIGLVGEIFIYASLPAVHEQMRVSITRFIVFDASGLLALFAALFLCRKCESTS